MPSFFAKILPLVPLALASCGGIPTQQFEFYAIDAEESPRPCLVVINDDWVGAAEKNHYVNVGDTGPLKLTLEFPSSELQVTMAPLKLSGGKPTKVPRSRKDSWESGYSDEQRTLFMTDPPRVLFILTRRPGSQ